MRIALVGWDIDVGVAGSLAGLGTEVVAFTRWFAGEAVREAREGWTLVRCPHHLGGGPRGEAASFADSVLHQAGQQGVGTEFDVIHALDARARPASAGLAERSPSALRVAAVASSELDEPTGFEDDDGAIARWICDHPWVGERWRALHPGLAERCRVVLGPASVPPSWRGARPRAPEAGPVLTLWMPRVATVDPELVVEGIALAQETLSWFMPGRAGHWPPWVAVRRSARTRLRCGP